MPPTLEELVVELAAVNAAVRHRHQMADCIVPSLNHLFAALGRLGLLNEATLLGEVLLDRNYGFPPLEHESGQVVQAAFFVPGGLGVVVWDSEEYQAAAANPSSGSCDPRLRFRPYEQCGLGLKALLLPHAQLALNHACCRLRAVEAESTT